MKNKIENFLYYLTLWFGLCVIILLILTLPFRLHTKPKKIYTLESIPTYDSMGNLYGVKKEYNHIPTHEDSILFNQESDKEIQKMIDSVNKK